MCQTDDNDNDVRDRRREEKGRWGPSGAPPYRRKLKWWEAP